MGEMEGKPAKSRARHLIAAADTTVEDAATFITRTVSWWEKIILKRTASLTPRSDPYNILVVTHGGFIGTMVRNLIQAKQMKCKQGVVIWRCANTSVTVIEVDRNRQGTVVKYGDTSHMKRNEGAVDNADEVDIKQNY
jgi:probable phosphoglycerate mutase